MHKVRYYFNTRQMHSFLVVNDRTAKVPNRTEPETEPQNSPNTEPNTEPNLPYRKLVVSQGQNTFLPKIDKTKQHYSNIFSFHQAEVKISSFQFLNLSVLRGKLLEIWGSVFGHRTSKVRPNTETWPNSQNSAEHRTETEYSVVH